ncbi:UBX domain-containing protein 10-like [Xyrauchen texanus]|uniref:UBX domain-containing protein 10-like n=1 Tax=Xyrauchen texanus TaxID=154827 RepID=UPI0022420DFE|nr:UBX domain-containing protein 10-like [Xyrauchen texanus]
MMHVTRPKSSKGRSRPSTQSVDTPVQHSSLSPQPPAKANDKFNQCIRSRAILRRSSQTSTERSADIYDKSPEEHVSLNKYRVLPSIEKKTAVNGPSTSAQWKALQFSPGGNSWRICRHQCEQSSLHVLTKAKGNTGMRNSLNTSKPPNQSESKGTGSDTGQTSRDEPDLLLAIRTPSGQRFKCHFHPTDKLQAVLSAAEAEFGDKFDNCLIDTMDVPRRTFANLSFAQCGVLNKSVLCISKIGNMDLT